MSQQRMGFDESYRDRPTSSSAGYEGVPHYNDYIGSHGQKLSGRAAGKAPTSGQRLALAIVSLISLVVITFGVIGLGMISGREAILPVLFVLTLFYSAVVIINAVFNRNGSA